MKTQNYNLRDSHIEYSTHVICYIPTTLQLYSTNNDHTINRLIYLQYDIINL